MLTILSPASVLASADRPDLVVLMLILGDAASLTSLLMLASLLVEDSVLEFDRRLPSQLSRVEDTERPRSVFLEAGGLGG